MKTETLSVAAPYLIEQDYSAYTDEQHAVWAELVGRVLPELEKQGLSYIFKTIEPGNVNMLIYKK